MSKTTEIHSLQYSIPENYVSNVRIQYSMYINLLTCINDEDVRAAAGLQLDRRTPAPVKLQNYCTN